MGIQLEEVNKKWQEKMSKYTANHTCPDQNIGTLQHLFYVGSDIKDDADSVMDFSSSSTPDRDNFRFRPQKFTGSTPNAKGLKQQCFFMNLDPEILPEYVKEHEAVWPEMQEALVRCGWHNYSLFFRPDGFAVGYFETDTSFEEAMQRMQSEEAILKWQEAMSKYTAKRKEGTGIANARSLDHHFYLRGVSCC